MLYYQVPQEMDQKLRFKYGRSGGLVIDGCFIANELYLPRELSRVCVNLNEFNKIEVSKNKVYFSFGCRFLMED